MPDIFNINFANKVIEWLPPDKRFPSLVAFIQSLFAPISWLQAKYLNQYLNGGSYTQWNPTIAGLGHPGYGLNAVVERKQVVYVSNIASNHDMPPSANWQVYLPSFLGANERVKFNGRKLVLEFALNQYFQTNFRQPGLLGYSYPANTPGTPTVPTVANPIHSDIFILNNSYEIVGFNVGTRDFIPDIFRSGGPRQGGGYIANLSKVMVGNNEYLCRVSNTDSSFNSLHWYPGVALPANYILTAGAVTHDISDNVDYPLWTNTNYTFSIVNPIAVLFQDFIYVLLKSTIASEAPGDENYWFKIDGIGRDKPFLIGDNFTIYIPAAVYAQSGDSEINNFVNVLADAGTRHNIATF